MRTPTRRLSVVIGGLLLAGAVSPALAAGGRPVRVTRDGVSILVPPPWGNRTALVAHDPQLARTVDAGGPLPLLYLTAPIVEFFSPNLILQRSPATLGDVATAQVLGVLHRELLGSVPRGEHRLPAHLPARIGGFPTTGEQLRGSLSGIVAGAPMTVSVIGQVFFIDVRGALYLLRFTVPASLWSHFQPAWTAMLRSLSFSG
ncbi:MAG TPA: hypothetical protein VNN74_09610 [Candidatus Micrarchaeia archaeon]|nr:hypothetical protein [Candidatus Micrarchaeia archaeon]